MATLSLLEEIAEGLDRAVSPKKRKRRGVFEKGYTDFSVKSVCRNKWQHPMWYNRAKSSCGDVPSEVVLGVHGKHYLQNRVELEPKDPWDSHEHSYLEKGRKKMEL